ncbi:MAG: hypothetical protein IPI35_20440 [Deltaproteobacteria bacterium]|nr:hypothetical protein [Deltaproteobacteria bacterium]
MLRALEPTYVRFILDADFERRLRLDDELAAAAGVNNADLERLRAVPAEALAVERRGRWGSLWDRVRAQLPRTATHLEHWLTREELGALWYDYYSNEFWALDETIPLPPFGKGMEMATTMRLCLRRRAAAGGVGDQLAADLAELECHKFRVLCGVVPAGERAGAGSSDFDVFAVYDDPRLGPDEVRLQTTVRWMVDHTGGVSLLTTAQRGWDALTTSCDTQVQFEGYRLNLFHTSATCYYVMGRKAEEVLDVIRGLDQRRGAGELELTAEERGTLSKTAKGSSCIRRTTFRRHRRSSTTIRRWCGSVATARATMRRRSIARAWRCSIGCCRRWRRTRSHCLPCAGASTMRSGSSCSACCTTATSCRRRSGRPRYVAIIGSR